MTHEVRTRVRRVAGATESRSPNCTTQVEPIIAAVGGTIEKTDNWGRRKLAYEIGRHKEGIYVLE